MRCSVIFGVTLRLLVINISSSSPAINTVAYYQRCVITCKTVAVVHRRPRLQHLPVAALTRAARYRLRIAISAYPTCIWRLRYGGSRRNIAMPFGVEKLKWHDYLMVKNFDDTFIRFETTHERDRRTDRQTDTAWWHRPRLHSIAWQKSSAIVTKILFSNRNTAKNEIQCGGRFHRKSTSGYQFGHMTCGVWQRDALQQISCKSHNSRPTCGAFILSNMAFTRHLGFSTKRFSPFRHFL